MTALHIYIYMERQSAAESDRSNDSEGNTPVNENPSSLHSKPVECVSTHFQLNAPAEIPKRSPRRIWLSRRGRTSHWIFIRERDACGSNPLWHRMTSGTLIMHYCTHNTTHTHIMWHKHDVFHLKCFHKESVINWNYLKPLCIMHFKGIHNEFCNALYCFINCNWNQS